MKATDGLCGVLFCNTAANMPGGRMPWHSFGLRMPERLMHCIPTQRKQAATVVVAAGLGTLQWSDVTAATVAATRARACSTFGMAYRQHDAVTRGT